MIVRAKYTALLPHVTQMMSQSFLRDTHWQNYHYCLGPYRWNNFLTNTNCQVSGNRSAWLLQHRRGLQDGLFGFSQTE